LRENRIRTIWGQGEAAINGWLTIPSSVSAETMAHQGFDSLVIDLQHGLIDYQTAVSILQAISTTVVTPMARVPWLEPGIIMKLLDAGAYGIICPMVNSREEAETFVGACRYAPKGYRSFGPLRALMYAGGDYPQKANDTVLTFAMIETAKALANLDSIATTPGLDAVYIGPADLSLSLGCEPRLDHTDPKVVAAIERILDAATKHGIKAGIHCASAAYAQRMISRGFRFATVMSDNQGLINTARTTLGALRQGPAKTA
jgi:4-hydroxy-2-oxoheptanedioate aldolase